MDEVINVLLELQESKQTVTLRVEDRQAAIRNAVKSVDPRIHVVFSRMEDAPSPPNSVPYILQKYSMEWNDFLDVVDMDEILHRDRLRVVPRPSVAQNYRGPTEGPSSSRTSSASGLTDTATSICQSLSKISGSVSQKMKTLFPSTTFTGGVKRPTSFDPTRESAVVENKKKKKKAVRIKPVILTVMAITPCTNTIPRGKHKKKAMDERREQKVQITRVMTSQEVQHAILSVYQHLQINDYEILESERSGRLSLAEEQSPDGASLVEGICKHKAVLYIRTKQSKDESEEDEGLPEAASILGKTAAVTIDISDDEPETNTDHLEPILPVIPPTSFYSTGLEEFRRIREEQDAEYNAMLENDLSLQNANFSSVEEIDQDEVVNSFNEQDVTEERTQLKDVLNDSFVADGYPIRMRLPGESHANLRCSFGMDVTTKNLYQYAFSFSNIERKFLIYTLSPRRAVPCSEELLLSDGAFGSAFAVEDNEDGIDPAVLFVRVDKSERNHDQDVESNALLMGSDHDAEAVHLYPLNLDEEQRYIDILKKTEQECHNFLESFCRPTGFTHTIRRSHLYDDALSLFADDSPTNEYPFYVEFKDEKAVDCGGVARDMFSGFWEEAAKRVFDGYNLLIPAIHPEIDMQVFPIMGCLLSHGFLACSYLPVVIAFPTLVGILLGPTTVIPDSILLHVFPDLLSDLEAGVLREAIGCKSQFTQELKNKLVAVLARFDCREIPTIKTIKALLIRISHYEFLSKPLAAVTLMNSGIPSAHKALWQSKSVGELYQVYMALTATPAKVLEAFYVETTNQNEERVLTYLQQFVGSMKQDMVRRFLRFTTGSSVCLSRNIKVTFNGLSGFSRHPISHTCTSMLKLPTTYKNYTEFVSEFEQLLMQPENEWTMDAI